MTEDFAGPEQLLHEWGSAARRLLPLERDTAVEEDYSEFEGLKKLSGAATLDEISELPIDSFGAIGDAVPIMTAKDFLWLLPVLLRFACRSEEPVFARAVVDRVRAELLISPEWFSIKLELSNELLEWMQSMASRCCLLGWDAPRRIETRLCSCRDVFTT